MTPSVLSAERLAALEDLALLDTDSEQAFDQLSELAQSLLGVPVVLFSLVAKDRQFFKSAVGLQGPAAIERQTPLSHSFCQHVVNSGAPFVVSDATKHPLVCENLAIRDLGVASYLGLPIRTPDGHVIGSFCAIDTKPHDWTPAQESILQRLAGLVMNQVALRHTLKRKLQLDERLEKVSQRVPGVIYSFLLRADGSSCFPYASEGIRSIYRVTPAEVRQSADKVFSVIHPADIAAVIVSIKHSATTLSPWCHEYRVKFSDGTELWLLGDALPERLPNGDTLWHGFITDVTERKLREQKLRSALDQVGRQQFAMDQHAIVAATNRAGTIVFANEKFTQVSGYSLDELIGKNHRILNSGTHPKAFFVEMYKTISAGKVWHGEICNRNKNGNLYWVATTIVPFFDETGGIEKYVSVRTEVTQLKQLVAEKEQMTQKLAETAKLESLGILAGGIAHDFNNILTTVLGNASLLRLDIEPNSDAAELVEQIETASRRAADLCKQMLAYSGKGRFIIAPLNLNEIVQETTRLLEISISKHAILRFHLAASLPYIEGDATQMRQILMNLIINASEAIGSRSGVIAITTGVARVDEEYLSTFVRDPDLPTGDYVFWEVSDNGSGMAPETVAKIFDPFFTTKFTGRGLGLSAVLGIVRGHKGAIKVYSEVGKGTTFKLIFPCLADQTNPVKKVAADVPLDWKGHGKVLIIDDEETVRTVAARMFEALSFRVMLASDGDQGVELYRKDPSGFSLVLLDLTMPHMDGEEAFRQLRHINPGVRVILTSGFNSQDVITRFAGKGLAGFIQKPFELPLLTAEVKKVFFAR